MISYPMSKERKTMHIILLSGGSGKRLWPLSNDVHSKQFLQIMDDQKGHTESMVQHMARRIRETIPSALITIATSKNQVSELKHQLGNDIEVSAEPERKDTLGAIILATSMLKEKYKLSDDEAVVVVPVDAEAGEEYFKSLVKLYDLAKNGDANLYLLGIHPTYATEKYGYILPKTEEDIASVDVFQEKPDLQHAELYIKKGALWSAGVYAFKVGYMMKKAHAMVEFKDHQDLLDRYTKLLNISFAFSIAEREPFVKVLKIHEHWADLGTWNTLTEAMKDDKIGNVVMGPNNENTHVINSLAIPVMVFGTKDLIVASSPDGILVSSKEGSRGIKPYVSKLDEPIRFAEKSWGQYQVIDLAEDCHTIKATLRKGHQMSYHSHQWRDETWTIVTGKGRVCLDGVIRDVGPGDVIIMNHGKKHTIRALTDLVLIEVQIGRDIDEDDKQKFPLDQNLDY